MLIAGHLIYRTGGHVGHLTDRKGVHAGQFTDRIGGHAGQLRDRIGGHAGPLIFLILLASFVLAYFANARSRNFIF